MITRVWSGWRRRRNSSPTLHRQFNGYLLAAVDWGVKLAKPCSLKFDLQREKSFSPRNLFNRFSGHKLAKLPGKKSFYWKIKVRTPEIWRQWKSLELLACNEPHNETKSFSWLFQKRQLELNQNNRQKQWLLLLKSQFKRFSSFYFSS